MAGLINELISVLDSEAELYESLNGTADEKKSFIVTNDVEALRGVTERENGLAGRLQKLEKARLSIIKDIANVLNEKPENLTLSSLAKTLNSQEEAEALSKVASRLRELADSLSAKNEIIASLIESALEYIDFSMNVMRSTFTDDTIYGQSGAQAKSVFVDKRN